MARKWERTSDMIGRTYNYLTVLGIDHVDHFGLTYVKCRCNACGGTTVLSSSNLKRGTTKSCGCMQKKLLSDYRLVDLTGRTFGYLKVLGLDHIGERGSYWKCKCICGKEPVISRHSLKCGTKSCGCMHDKLISESKLVFKTPEEKRLNRIFSGMLTRCYNKNSENYPNYGGRGIYICEEWLKDKWKFIKWSLTHGYSPDRTIDRWPNNDGPYAPWNCRWSTPVEQSINRRSTRFITVGDTTMVLYYWMQLFHEFRAWCNRAYSTPRQCVGDDELEYGFADEEASAMLGLILDDFAKSIGTNLEETPVSKLIDLYRESEQFKERNKYVSS